MSGEFRDKLILGTLSFRTLPEKQCYSILDKFFDFGGSWIDTAYLYGFGEVERMLGRYLRTHQPAVRLATKIGYFPTDDCYRSAAKLCEAFEASCLRLGRLPDVVALHEADWLVWWAEGAKAGETVSASDFTCNFDQIEELQVQLQAHGVRLGLTGTHAGALECVLHTLPVGLIGVVMIAKQYDLLWRTGGRLATTLGKCSVVECWLASPFHQGWLLKLDELRQRVPAARACADRLQSLLVRHQIRVSDVAIAFIRSTQPHARIALGVNSTDEVGEAARALTRQLDQAVVAELLTLGFEGECMPGPIQLQI